MIIRSFARLDRDVLLFTLRGQPPTFEQLANEAVLAKALYQPTPRYLCGHWQGGCPPDLISEKLKKADTMPS